jgi:hypothetical protein
LGGPHGEAGSFEELVDAFGPRVHRLARRYAASDCDAEDLTQEIFVALFKSAGSFRGDSALRERDVPERPSHTMSPNSSPRHCGQNRSKREKFGRREKRSPMSSTQQARQFLPQ